MSFAWNPVNFQPLQATPPSQLSQNINGLLLVCSAAVCMARAGCLFDSPKVIVNANSDIGMYPHVEESDRWCNIYLYIVNLADLIDQQSLKETLHRIVPQKQEEVKEFRKQHGNAKLGEYTIDQVRMLQFMSRYTQQSRNHCDGLLNFLFTSLALAYFIEQTPHQRTFHLLSKGSTFSVGLWTTSVWEYTVAKIPTHINLMLIPNL